MKNTIESVVKQIKLLPGTKGETPTSFELCLHEVNQIPDNVWKDNNTKILDLTCGTGNKLFACLHKINSIGGDVSYAVKNRIYGNDISLKQTLIVKSALKKITGQTQNNISGEDAMLKNYKGLKFDVITINPAYEGTSDSDSIKTWNQIVYKCASELLNDDGYMLVDTPRSVLNSSGSSTIKANKPTFLMQKFLEEHKFISYDETANEYFESVEANVCSWIVQKTKVDDNHQTKFIMEDGEILLKKYIAGDKIRTTLKDSIITKVTESSHEKYKRYRTVYTESIDKNGVRVHKEKTKEFNNPVIWNTTKTEIMFSKDHIRPEKKLAINNYKDFKASDVNLIVTTSDVSSAYFSIIDNDVEKLQKLLTSSKLFQYVGNNFKNSKGVMLIAQRQEVIPKLDLSLNWTDDMLYKEFSLTEEEITEVEHWYEHNRN